MEAGATGKYTGDTDGASPREKSAEMITTTGRSKRKSATFLPMSPRRVVMGTQEVQTYKRSANQKKISSMCGVAQGTDKFGNVESMSGGLCY